MMKTRVLVLADIHGSFKPVRELYKAHKQELDQTNNILILLGDAGLNFFFNHRDNIPLLIFNKKYIIILLENQRRCFYEE